MADRWKSERESMRPNTLHSSRQPPDSWNVFLEIAMKKREECERSGKEFTPSEIIDAIRGDVAAEARNAEVMSTPMSTASDAAEMTYPKGSIRA